MSSRFSLSRSLKTRVTLYTLAIFIFSLWSLSFYASKMLQEDMQRVLGEQQFATASLIAAEINDHLSDRIAALELIAKEIDAQLIGNPAALQARLEQRPILSIMFNGGTWVSAQEGIVIASNLPVLIGANYSDRPYLITVLKEGKSAISKPITGKVLKDPIFLTAVPIHDSVGKVIGAIAGTTDLSKTNFLDKSAKGQYGKSGGVLLNAPQYRLIITGTDKTRIMQPLPPPGVNKMLDRYMQGYEGYGVSVNSRGMEELSSAKGIPVAGWVVGVVMPTAEAFAPVYDMQQRMLLATILLTLLAGGLTWWMLRMQLAPMLSTARTMARIATAKQPLQALPINHQDEVGDMVAGFNLLLESWRHSESRFKLIFNDAPFGMALVDSLTGKIHEVNPMFARIARRSVAQMLEIDWTSANQPHYVSEDRYNMAMLNAGKIAGFQMEKRYLHEDGTPIWINMTIAAFEVDDKTQPRHICMVEDISERKQVEAAFRESERRFHRMANSAPVLIWLSTPDKLCHWFNEFWLSFTGRTMEQEMGNGWAEGVHPDDLQRCLDTYTGAFDARQEFTMEYRLRRFDGEYRWLIDSGTPSFDEQGTFFGYIGSCVDITDRKNVELERKRIEAELRESETRFRTLFTHNNAIILQIEPVTGRILDANAAASAFYGWTHDELCARNIQDINQLEATQIAAEREAALDERRSYFVFPHLLANGETRTVEVYSTPVEVGGRKILVSIIHDITNRKTMEDRIESLLTEQKAMLNNGLVGIVTVKDRRIVWVNPAFEQILGFNSGELDGTLTRQNYPSEEAFQSFGTAAYPVLAAGKVFRTQTGHVRKDGQHIWVDVSGEMLDQQSDQSLWVFLDITERKRAEDKLRQLSIAVEQSPVSVVITDLNANIEYVNDRFTQVTGYSAPEAIGQNPKIFKSGLTSSQTYAEMWGRLCSGVSWQGEIVNRRKDGEHYWEDVQIAPVKNSLGVVTHYVAIKSDITERKEMAEQIRQLAFHDTLTNLPNRRLLMDRVAQALAAGKRSGSFGGLVYLDLDNFKPLNDKHGHGFGDMLLMEVAHRLIDCVRAVDTVSRIGGDEFVVLLGDLTKDRAQAAEQAKKLADKVRVTLAQPYLLPGGSEAETIEHRCGASIGVVLIEPQHQSVEGLLKWADTVMYQSKAEGRNRITFMSERRAIQRS